MNNSDLKSKLQTIDPYDFEAFVAELWEIRGWETELTDKSKDSGIDIIATKSKPFNKKQIIQTKKYSKDNKIGAPEIRQYDGLRRVVENVDSVIIVTTSGFTSSASEYAKKANIKCMNIKDLSTLILELDAKNLVHKYGNIDEISTNLNTESRQNVTTDQLSVDSSKAGQEQIETTTSQEASSYDRIVDQPMESDYSEYPASKKYDKYYDRMCPNCEKIGLVWDETGETARCKYCEIEIRVNKTSNPGPDGIGLDDMNWEYI